MMTKTEIGIVYLQTKEHQRLPHMRNQVQITGSPLVTLERTPFTNNDFELLSSRTVRECISVVLSHTVCGALLQQPQETDTPVDNNILSSLGHVLLRVMDYQSLNYQQTHLHCTLFFIAFCCLGKSIKNMQYIIYSFIPISINIEKLN